VDIRLASGESTLLGPIQENLFRAPLDNDWILGKDISYARDWERVGLSELRIESRSCHHAWDGGGESPLLIKTSKVFVGREGFQASWESAMCLEADGRLSFDHVVDVEGPLQTLPRIGVRLRLDQ
jgi:hypothetical protein